ncbi:MAG: PaaI family thioesterase [Rhodococcus sp. (in: high G+C Gram-positive bacteria)]|uniref:PaaI family thioesterase n=1 Tax=Rhodococcus sp. TaxID=1831 RepID=UPI003BB5948B
MTDQPTLEPASATEFGSAGFGSALGLEYIETSADRVVARWTVTSSHHQPYGIVHGGVYCAVIESVASIAGAVWFGDRGHVVGVNNNTDFLRATRDGVLTATATPLQRGRTQQLWQVAIVDERGRTVAHGQVRLANIADADHIGR